MDTLELGDLLERVEPEDLIEFGMIPEFVGRLPIVCVTRPLDNEALMRVLTEPRNAILRQYQKFFEMENAKLSVTPTAMEAIADIALLKKTGARGLRAIVENLFLDVMFDLPSRSDPRDYRIDADNVRGEKPIAAKARRTGDEELRETA
jgi:ATP-dependent Clp protease ATP-binding subunit ClpX